MTAAELVAVMLIFSDGKHEGRSRTLAHALISCAEMFDVPPIELAAIAWNESAYNVMAIGRVGERGPLQVAPGSAETWCRHLPRGTTPWHVETMCGAHLYALAKARCPAHPFTSYNRPSKCGPSRYETKVRATLRKVTK